VTGDGDTTGAGFRGATRRSSTNATTKATAAMSTVAFAELGDRITTQYR
jgi:hypothetical protein